MITTMPLPDWLEQRHHTLNEAARRLYRLRDLELQAGEQTHAADLHHKGDEHFARALAILAEFEADLTIL